MEDIQIDTDGKTKWSIEKAMSLKRQSNRCFIYTVIRTVTFYIVHTLDTQPSFFPVD